MGFLEGRVKTNVKETVNINDAPNRFNIYSTFSIHVFVYVMIFLITCIGYTVLAVTS
jgi:hypothetical protein